MKRKKQHTSHSRGDAGVAVTDRRIMVIDDGPLRDRAARDCGRAMEKLEKAKAELRSFEQEDQPAYQRWLAATFGALMTELRENAALIQEQGMLIDAIEMEMLMSGCRSPRQAYAAVMKRRANAGTDEYDDGYPEDDEEDWGLDDDGDEPPFEDMAGQVSDKEERILFEEYVKQSTGFDPKQFPKEEYEELYAEFKAHMFGTQRRPRRSHARETKAPQEAPPGANRIKEIYRMLVRRLHPDTRADGDPTVSALWHEVQQAYEAGNLDRLETLLALTEMKEGNGSQTKTSLFQMRAVLAELKRAMRAIQRSMMVAKRDFAWGFARTPYHGELEKRIRRNMQRDLANQRSLLADFKETLDDWSQPYAPSRRKAGKRATRATGVMEGDQLDLF